MSGPGARQVRGVGRSQAEGHRTSDPEIEDEDSCNMTAVDPTSMLRSCDDNEEPTGSSGGGSVQKPRCPQASNQKKDTMKLMATMNSMRKSEKRKFQMFLQHLASSNNRSVDLRQLNEMLSRLSEEGKWTVASAPASPAAVTASTTPRTQQLPPHPNYDHILPPNLERQQQTQQPPVTSQPHQPPRPAAAATSGLNLQQAGASLLQVAPSIGSTPMSIPVGDTSLLVTRNPTAAAAASDYHSQAAVLDHIPSLMAVAPTASQLGLPIDTSPVASNRVDDSIQHRLRAQETYNRYKRTEQILRESGMYDIAMQTRELEKKNQELQAEIDQFNRDANKFLHDVLQNPQNKWLRDKLVQQRQQQNQSK